MRSDASEITSLTAELQIRAAKNTENTSLCCWRNNFFLPNRKRVPRGSSAALKMLECAIAPNRACDVCETALLKMSALSCLRGVFPGRLFGLSGLMLLPSHKLWNFKVFTDAHLVAVLLMWVYAAPWPPRIVCLACFLIRAISFRQPKFITALFHLGRFVRNVVRQKIMSRKVCNSLSETWAGSKNNVKPDKTIGFRPIFKAILFSNSTKACCAVTATVTSALLTQEALFTVHRYISVFMLSLHKSTAKFPFLCGLCFACSAACDHRCAGGRPPYARCAAVVAVRVCDGASGPWRGLLAE